MTNEQVQRVLAEITKRFGEGMAICPGEHATRDVEAISTGSIRLDKALGVGGVPKGYITEIFGPETGGKTTLAQHLVASCQAQGGIAVYIDMEHRTDPKYMTACGVDLERLILSQPPSGESALDLVASLLKTDDVSLVVVDSVAALVASSELDADAGAQMVGVQARLMSSSLKRINPLVGRGHAALVFVNQIRNKIGVMYGSPETTPGGVALKFYASVRMRIAKTGFITGQGGKRIGIKSRVRVVKNSVAPPWGEADIEILWGRGIDLAGEILDMAVGSGLIEKSGAYYRLDGEIFARGRENAKEFLRRNQELMEELRESILSEGQGRDNGQSEDSNG